MADSAEVDPRKWRGDWALITGASSGIGREYATRLASFGMNVVLVARREERLAEIRRQVTADGSVQAMVEARDLSQPGSAGSLRNALAAKGVRIRLLCNCAAFGRWGRAEGGSAALYEQMIALNAGAVAALCRVFLEDLCSHPSGAIVNVSSPAALQPVPYMAVYAATKAFVHNLSQALYEEWRERGVYVQTLVPGPTTTEFDQVAGAYASALEGRGTPQAVVEASLAAFGDQRPLAVAASRVRVQQVFAALAPPRFVLRKVGAMFAPPK